MTTYLALARKWRPRAFDQIVGQSHVVTALRNALSFKKLHHAYLLTGTHGVGKTTLARIFAKSLNCESGITPTPCNQCTHCKEIDAGRFPDLYEIDAASRTKVEDTRDLLDNVPYAPTKGRFKVYLIDEVHMLSGHSFNALLKTLEEPPAHVKFLLATTDPQKLPATVLSRCLQFHLSQLLPEQIEAQLAHILNEESITFEQEALTALSTSANGSMRDALSLLDQCIAFCNEKITTSDTKKMLGLSNQSDVAALLTAIDEKDAATALSLTKAWAQNGANFKQVLTSVLTQLHEMAVNKALNPDADCDITPENIQLYYQIALLGQKDLPFAPTPRSGFEMVVIRMIAFKPSTNEPQQKIKLQKNSNINANISTKKTSAPSQVTTETSDWAQLLTLLDISGPTLAFAQQCVLITLTQDTLHLSLNPKYKAIYSERNKTRLEEAAKNHFKRNINVVIDIKESTKETPAESTARADAEKKQSAKNAINTDPTVQRMIAQFDATVVEDSIEPL